MNLSPAPRSLSAIGSLDPGDADVVLELVLAAILSAVDEPSRPLAGCLQPAQLRLRVAKLRAAKWSEWRRKTLQTTWPEALEFTGRDYYTNDVVGFRRAGRIINGNLECGEDYVFETPG